MTLPVIVITGGAMLQLFVAGALFALWYLRARATAQELAALHAEVGALRETLLGQEPASWAARRRDAGPWGPTVPPPLPYDDLLALGRSLAFQLLRGERVSTSFTHIESQAVQEYRASPQAEREHPGSVLRHVKDG